MVYSGDFTAFKIRTPLSEMGSSWNTNIVHETQQRWHRPSALLLAAAGFYPLLVALLCPPYLNDDAYITLTYARSIAAGEGFVYNAGPPTLGTTTPLQALLVAMLSWILPWLSLDRIAVGLSAICALLTPWPLYLARRAFGLDAWSAALAGLSMLLFVHWFPYGMEAHLFAFLTVLSAALFFAGRPFLSGFTGALLVLTRGEGALFMLLLGLAGFAPLFDRNINRRAALGEGVRTGTWLSAGFLVPMLPWLLYATMTFGSPLPATLAAKRAQGALGVPLFRDRFFVRLTEWGSYFPGLSWMTWVYHALAITGLITLVRGPRRVLIFPAWGVAYVAAYSALGVAWYWWYDLAPFTVWTLLVGLGLGYAASGLSQYLPSIRFRIAVLTVLIGAFSFLAAFPNVWKSLSSPGYPRGEIYLAAATYLREHVQPGDRVAAGEAGYLGFFGQVHLLDLYGLTDPDSLAHYARGDYSGAFWTSEPAWFVTFEDDPPWNAIRANPRFTKEYTPVWQRAHAEARNHCQIYRRNAP